MSWAAKLFSLNEVPFTTGASSSNGFTAASEVTVMYCRANHRAVLPSWSLSSRSSLSGGRGVSRVTGRLEQLRDSVKRQSPAYCLHCRSWLNTGSFPDATASCSGVLEMTNIVICIIGMSRLIRPGQRTGPCCSACSGWLRSSAEPLQFGPSQP